MKIDPKALEVAIKEVLGGMGSLGDGIDDYAAPFITAYLRAREKQGYVEVPKKATVKMMSAAQSAWLRDPLKRTTTMYEAMLAARPQKETDQ